MILIFICKLINVLSQKIEKIRNENFHSYSVSEDEFSFLEKLYDWLIQKQTG